MGHLDIGVRMKKYEHAFKYKLPIRTPVLIRVDGKAFHTFTRGMKRPFDNNLMEVMDRTALRLCKNIHTTVMAYVQSDEITLLLHNYKKINSEPWLGNVVQKIVSISAARATLYFYINFQHIFHGCVFEYDNVKRILDRESIFDARTWVLPEHEVCNYFIWRQLDWQRNSLSMLARSYYSQKELEGKGKSELHDLIFEKGGNWSVLPVYVKRGRCIIKDEDGDWVIDKEIPDFTKDRDYVNDLLKI